MNQKSSLDISLDEMLMCNCEEEEEEEEEKSRGGFLLPKPQVQESGIHICFPPSFQTALDLST